MDLKRCNTRSSLSAVTAKKLLNLKKVITNDKKIKDFSTMVTMRNQQTNYRQKVLNELEVW